MQLCDNILQVSCLICSMCWASMQINYTIKHWGWGDCCALPNSPKSREKKLSPVIHYQWVFCRENMEVCVPYLQWYYAGQQTYISEKIANKMTDIQAISISRDITPCMLFPVKPFQHCGTFADTRAPATLWGLVTAWQPSLLLLSPPLLS